MDKGKLINIDITYISNTDNVTNFQKNVLNEPHIIIILFNQTNWNLWSENCAYNLHQRVSPCLSFLNPQRSKIF